MYIKLDKKLIVEIEEINVSKKSQVKNSIEDLQSTINKVPTVLQYFSKIDIELLHIDGNDFKILFDNDHIYINNKFVNFASKYQVKDNVMMLDLYSLHLKDIDLLLLGKVKLDYNHDITNFFGHYVYKDNIEGEINSQVSNNHIDFFVTTKPTKSLKFLKDFMTLDSIAEAWMYDNVKGEITLDYLYGKVNIDTMTPILDSIKGYATIKDALVKFNPKLPAIKTSKLSLEYANDNLFIKLIDPQYEGIKIDGSYVNISNMTSLEKGRVDVNIEANHILDDRILNILKAYDLKLPLKQLDGQTKAKVLLKIPYEGAMQTFGDFKVSKSNLLIDSFPFYSKRATVELKKL